MKKIFTLLLFCTALCANAQMIPQIQWERSLGSESNDTAAGVAATADGGYIVYGNVFAGTGNVTTHYGSADYWVAKLDADGTLEWERTYGGTDYDAAGGLRIETSRIHQTSDGGYILGGVSMSYDTDVSANSGGTDVWIVKIDNSGDIEWEQNYGTDADEYFSDIKETNEGGFIMTYTSSDYNTLIFNTTIAKIDVLGNIEWANAYGEGEYKYSNLYSITQTSDGGYISTGWTNADNSAVTPEDEIFPGFYNVSRLWVLKISTSGAFEWARTYGGSNIEEGYCIVEDAAGNYVVTGMTYSGDGDVSSHPDPDNVMSPWILKLDTAGEILWEKTYGRASNAVAVEVMPDGNYAIGGSFVQAIFSSNNGDVITSQGSTDEFLMKLDQATGNIIWTKTMGGTSNDNLWNFTLTPDSGFITIGSSRSVDGDITGNNGGFDYWVVKLGPDCEVPVMAIDTAYTVCAGNELMLTAASAGNTINWYASQASPTILFTGSEFVLPAVTAGGSYWVEAVSPTGCTAGRTEVTVTVNPLPALTVAATALSICENATATLTAATTAGNDIEWYISASAATPIASGTEFTTPALTADTSYWVLAITPEGCVSARTEITVTVNALPEVTVQDTAVCGSTAAAITAASAGNTINWYAAATDTTPLFTGAAFTTPVLAATTSYWVEALSAEGCSSARTEVTVTVNTVPVITVQSANVCEGAAATITAASAGNTINWYSTQNDTTILFTGTDFTTPSLSASTSYWVEAVSAQGCSTARVQANVTVEPLPVISAGDTSVTICAGNTAVLSAAATGSNLVVWFDSETATQPIATGADYTTQELSASASYWVAAYNPQTHCESAKVPYTVTVNDNTTPVVEFSYGEATYCFTAADPIPVFAPGFTQGGTFSAAAGLALDGETGEINIRTSQPGNYVVVYEVNDEDSCLLYGRFETQVTIDPCADIQRGISPNGDEYNQYFDLTGMGVRELAIFNRYGQEVYGASNYVKEWQGQDRNGNELPTGTYFYSISRTDGKQLTGWIYINRASK
ncbi:Ig-like domain-containing protein [Flavobacterium sp.]|uniref:Ig-like domain-containing protein n=1 Tax=Flavobacterium sp. TaxID=239 RepID=UPI004033C12B